MKTQPSVAGRPSAWAKARLLALRPRRHTAAPRVTSQHHSVAGWVAHSMTQTHRCASDEHAPRAQDGARAGRSLLEEMFHHQWHGAASPSLARSGLVHGPELAVRSRNHRHICYVWVLAAWSARTVGHFEWHKLQRRKIPVPEGGHATPTPSDREAERANAEGRANAKWRRSCPCLLQPSNVGQNAETEQPNWEVSQTTSESLYWRLVFEN